MKFIQLFVCLCIVCMANINPAFPIQHSIHQQTDSLVTTTLKVKGITCATDLKMISSNVEKLKGVKSFKPGKQGTTTTFELSYNPLLVTEKDILNAIESTGSCENPDERPYKVKR